MEKYNHFKFVKKLFLKNLILVTGTHTSGKSMISPVIASFKKVEMLRKIDTLDRIAVLTNFGKIKKDISTYLAKNILDFSYYEQLIGRNLNFRHEDETGVSQSKNPNYFKKRIYVPRGPNVLKEHNKKNTHMLLDTHNGLWFYDFWNTLNIHNLKIISIFRNPIDVVNSWVNADFGITEKKILNQIPLIVHKKKIKNFYNYNFINHTKKNKNDVIVDMVGEAFLKDLTSYEKIKNKKKIFRVEFNKFAENTNLVIKEIKKFLKLNSSQFTKKIMARERLPRKIKESMRNEKIYKIKNLVSQQKYLKLLKLETLFYKHKNKYKF